jgi:hypothetical protein
MRKRARRTARTPGACLLAVEACGNAHRWGCHTRSTTPGTRHINHCGYRPISHHRVQARSTSLAADARQINDRGHRRPRQRYPVGICRHIWPISPRSSGLWPGSAARIHPAQAAKDLTSRQVAANGRLLHLDHTIRAAVRRDPRRLSHLNRSCRWPSPARVATDALARSQMYLITDVAACGYCPTCWASPGRGRGTRRPPRRRSGATPRIPRVRPAIRRSA